MARNLDPKCKQCRRAGERLFLKGERCSTPKCAIVKRNYPPGFHGPKGSKRQSGYGLQLNEKQKAKRQYLLLEKQFYLTFKKAKMHRGNTADIFMQFLELRLDNAIYRSHMAPSRAQARQLVSHGHFTVNGRMVNIPSFQLKPGDEIKIKSNKADHTVFKNLEKTDTGKNMPEWLSFNAKEKSIKILNRPDPAAIAPNFNIQMIIEYYSR